MTGATTVTRRARADAARRRGAARRMCIEGPYVGSLWASIMRWDMYKVIVERPRLGGQYPVRRCKAESRALQQPEQAPLREPISRGRGSKHLNENLAPLRRFLLRQVGRAWDRVHAEICANLRLTSAIQRHVLEHLEEFVARDVVMDGRRPLRARDRRPVLASKWRDVVYVEPRTGLLRRAPGRVRTTPPPNRDRVELPDGHQLQRLGGVWYHVTLLAMPQERWQVMDVVLRVRLDAPDGWALGRLLAAQHGRAGVYAARKVQLGKRALARMVPEGLR